MRNNDILGSYYGIPSPGGVSVGGSQESYLGGLGSIGTTHASDYTRADYDRDLKAAAAETRASNAQYKENQEQLRQLMSDNNDSTQLNKSIDASDMKTDAATSEILDPFSYVSIIQDLNRYRSSARSESAMYDMPGQVFFRVMFHFNNGSDSQIAQPGTLDRDWADVRTNSWTGLIAPSWLSFGNISVGEIAASAMDNLGHLWSHSTAFNYLITNNELGRANNLRKFIELLSTISAESPWYFQNIKGLDTAIDRQIAAQNSEFNLKDERDKITIECLDDSYDQRIGTLLDLYRSVVWSWETKRIILPTNLRKFDMTIVAFQMPIKGQHIKRDKFKMNEQERYSSDKSRSSLESLAVDSTGHMVVVYDGAGTAAPVASYKAWEFHGCEIDYNSSKSGWGDLSNSEGTVPKFNIDIMYDDMYEIRFNEFLKQHVTDLMGDTNPTIYKGDSVIEAIKNKEIELQELEKQRAALNEARAQQRQDLKQEGNKLKTLEQKRAYNEYNDQRNQIDSQRIDALKEKQRLESMMTEQAGDVNSDGEMPHNTQFPVYNVPAGGISLNSPRNGRPIFGDRPRKGSSIIDQIVGHGQAWLETKVKKLYLGNMSGLSLSTIRQQLGQAASGDVFATAANISNYTRGNYKNENKPSGENIFPTQLPTDTDRLKDLGNIFKSNTTLNT